MQDRPNTPPAQPVATCPMHAAGEAFKPFEHEGMYSFFARIRPEVPIFHAPDIDYWVVTRREDVLAIFRDHERFSAQISTQPICPWPTGAFDYLKQQGFQSESVQVGCDPPRHTRVREAAIRFLNIRQFSTYAEDLRRLVRGYLDKIESHAQVDLVDAIFYEFPAQVVFLLLGERGFDPLKIKKWGDLRLNMVWGNPTPDELESGVRDLAEFWTYSANLVAARKAQPGEDYASFLLARRAGDDSVLTENEITSLVFGLLLAGHETTTNAAGNLFLELLKRPAQWARLVENPDLIPNAVEEGLRHASSVIAWRRTAKQDVTICGQSLPAGSKILLALASANHDEAWFDNPQDFDIERPNARDHVAFGNGVHFCLGAALARLELRILLEEFTARFPNMALAPDQQIEWTRTISFRGPNRLMVRLQG